MRPQRCHRAVDEPLQVVGRLVRAGDAEAAELRRERLALAGGGQDRDLEAVGRQPPAAAAPMPLPPAVMIATFSLMTHFLPRSRAAPELPPAARELSSRPAPAASAAGWLVEP